MQSTCALIALLASTALCPATSLRRARSAGRMQPELVAQSLLKIENEWRSEAQVFAECNATVSSGSACQPAVRAFEKSCGTIVSAVQQASSGDRTVVKEYMGEICGMPALEGWHKERCMSMAATITGAMTADSYDNRQALDVGLVCQNFWSRFASEEAVRLAKEREAQAVEQKKLQAEREEAAKQAAVKAAAEAAVQEKRRQEEAAEQEKRREAEEAEEAKRKVEEEKAKAEEAKRFAAEEAANLKAKEEEALRQAEEAKHKMEELKAAAEEAHKKSEEKAANAAKTTKRIATAPVNAKAAVAVVPAKQQKVNATIANTTKF